MQKVHLKAPANWINDPNGFIFYKGKYHLFYQYFPYEPVWGTMHWGHAVSDDLVMWEHKGIALYPSKYDDQNGCFSGSAVEYNGKMYLFYTGVNYVEVNPENIHVALNDNMISAQMMISSEDGMSFNNHEKKTVIKPIDDENIGSKKDTRDPKVWRGKKAWYMALGSKTPDGCGKLLLYRSYDLEKWEYINQASKQNWGYMWECPDYYEVNGAGVFTFSPMGILNDGLEYRHTAVCAEAFFDEDSCSLDIAGDYRLFDYGIDLYAPQSAADKEGRRVVVAWARMPEQVNGKWSGMFCIPRVAEVKNSHIYFRPHPNVADKFSKKISDVLKADEAGYRISADIKDGGYIDIGGFKIFRKGKKIFTDRSKVFRKHLSMRNEFSSPEIENEIHLDIYVDPNLIEIYINNGECVITNVVYDIGSYVLSDGDVECFTVNMDK